MLHTQLVLDTAHSRVCVCVCVCLTRGDFLTVFSLQASDDLAWLTLAFSSFGTEIFDPAGFLHF